MLHAFTYTAAYYHRRASAPQEDDIEQYNAARRGSYMDRGEEQFEIRRGRSCSLVR